jgi:Holliday junction resolvase RusA-like endonuclease
MSTIIKERASFRIVGYPVGWTAPKQGKTWKGKKNFYQSDKLKHWQETIRAQIIHKHRPILLDGPLCVQLYFFLVKAPSNKSSLPVVKPDTDNLIKGTIDAMKKLVYRDDNCVTDVIARKRWCSRRYQPHGGKPGVDISISIVDE